MGRSFLAQTLAFFPQSYSAAGRREAAFTTLLSAHHHHTTHHSPHTQRARGAGSSLLATPCKALFFFSET